MCRPHTTAPGGGLRTRWLLPLAVLAVCVTIAHCRPVDCRVNVFHASCRGVARRSGRNRLAGLADGPGLHRLLTAYFSDQSRARKLRALERYLSMKKPDHVTEQQAASLLDRLLPIAEDDYGDDYDA